jgi:hypothetical protein
MSVPHLIGRWAKKHLDHHNALADAVNALTEGAAMPEDTNGPHQIGMFVGDPGDGNFIGFENDEGSARLTYTDGNNNALVKTGRTRAVMQWSGELNCSVQVDDEGVKIPNLPAVDPHIAGVLWDDGGTLKRSQG